MNLYIDIDFLLITPLFHIQYKLWRLFVHKKEEKTAYKITKFNVYFFHNNNNDFRLSLFFFFIARAAIWISFNFFIFLYHLWIFNPLREYLDYVSLLNKFIVFMPDLSSTPTRYLVPKHTERTEKNKCALRVTEFFFCLFVC